MSLTCTACSSAATTTCATCRAALCTEHTYLGEPFISARQLVTTTTSTALRAPKLLGDILFKPLDSVAYCAECREELAAKRQTEQLKFLLGFLAVLVLVVGVPFFLLMG